MFEVYGTPQCPWCDRVKDLISKNNLEYNYTDVSESIGAQKMFREKQLRTVPQVFLGDKHIGGYEATQQYLNKQYINDLKENT